MNKLRLTILFNFCTVLVLFLSVFILESCSCNCGARNSSDVPLSVLTKANDFIISKTGKEFFDKYITPEFALIKYQPPDYKMAYRFFIPEKPFVNEFIKFTVDGDGNIDTNYEISGIPDFKSNPGYCDFSIDEKGAIQSAQKSGLEEGITPWKTGLVWDATLNRYTWHVLATSSQSGEKNEFKGSGKELVIDPGNGKVLAVNYWHIP